MKRSEEYLNSVHRIGRIGTVGALGFMIGIPYLIATVYNIWPSLNNVLKVSSGLLALFIPIAISEIISFMPIVGSASYITFLTGNVLNLKLPCALNALQMTDTPQGSVKSDVIVTIAIATSSIVTMGIIFLGVILIVPLSPLFQKPVIQTAITYMLPALFGGMFVPMLLNKSVGDYEVKGKLFPTIIPVILIVFVNQFVRPISGLEGIAMLVVIPIMIVTSNIMYKKGIIKMIKREETRA